MKKLSFLFLLLICFISEIQAQKPSPANPASIVNSGNDVRFTILTDGAIRLEWDANGNFNDLSSFTIVNRNLPTPRFKTTRKSGWLTISTDKMILRYKEGSGKFTASNLTIDSPSKKGFKWNPSVKQSANLKGTSRTLDLFDGDWHYRDKYTMEIEDGIVSRDGWTLIDDSGSFLFDDSDWSWVTTRENTNAQDWYFMAYEHDYKAALKDYSLIAGKTPLPPRYAFGYWWSRFWSYSDKEMRTLVNDYRKYNLPIDVLVVDMDWHRIDSIISPNRDEFGEMKWWTGWSWNTELFPDPEKFLQWTKKEKLRTTLNLHPASGIAPFEDQYQEFAKKMNFDTSTGRNIPYQGSNKKFMTNLFDVVLTPMEKWGVDFWWLDWQQWLNDKDVDGLSNTWWINYVFFTHMERNSDKRPLLYHRWGGLGNHRYQIGFSGDAIISWKTLEFQPYFTSCASNVLYGYWSHDIGGHDFLPGQEKPLDPELHTRWMQYGVYTPILRTHSTKNKYLTKEIWNFKGDFFDAQYEAIKQRYRLVPYIYTMARKFYDDGLALCRPMYYEYPENEEAYDFKYQYMFGDDMLIAPISSPMTDGESTVKVWLPQDSQWYEWNSGTLLNGGQIAERKFTIDQYPVYIKAGAIIPMYDDTVNNLTDQPDMIHLTIFPGAEGEARLYEDEGNDNNYSENYAFTNYSTTKKGNSMLVNISAREGKYNNNPETRDYLLKMVGSAVPVKVLANGKEVDFNYVGEELTLEIPLGELACDAAHQIEIVYPENTPEINDGLVGQFKRLTKATTELKARNPVVLIPAEIGQLEQRSIMLEYYPQNFNELIRNFKDGYKNLPHYIDAMPYMDADMKSWYKSEIGL